MHVGLNLLFLVPGETGGTEVYARELIPQLTRIAPDLRLTAFINAETAAHQPAWLGDISTVTLPVMARSRSQWVFGEQALLPRRAAERGVEILHSLANTGPATGSFLRILTVHDLHFAVAPEAHLGLNRLGMQIFVTLAARRSQRIIAISEATRTDVLCRLNIPAGKIDLVPQAGSSLGDVNPTTELEIRQTLGAGSRPIVLSVAAKRPHKNLARLLAAVADIPRDTRPMLVIPGYKTPYAQELTRLITRLDLTSDVRMLNWVSEAFLEGLYAAAACVVCPSLHEGFGLPVLEAMQRGVPVLCSAGGALAEVAGGAALLFEPTSIRQMTDTIRIVLTDPTMAATLSHLGRKRARDFSWERTAQATLQTYATTVR